MLICLDKFISLLIPIERSVFLERGNKYCSKPLYINLSVCYNLLNFTLTILYVLSGLNILTTARTYYRYSACVSKLLRKVFYYLSEGEN